ncbi:MAG: hypothetical protein LBG11_06545, partial [Bifidobacteriaceae bacterium]|nr:hypothetical protein [Bifidobacteriaceae bacterium]
MVFDPSHGEAAARQLLADPSTSPDDLARIAASFPALLALVAAHPNLRPELESWLRQLHRSDIDQALAARLSAPPPQSAAGAFTAPG